MKFLFPMYWNRNYFPNGRYNSVHAPLSAELNSPSCPPPPPPPRALVGDLSRSPFNYKSMKFNDCYYYQLILSLLTTANDIGKGITIRCR